VSKRADRRTITPEEAPDQAEMITIGFKEGDAVSVNGQALKAHELLKALNDIGKKHGIGGLDLVENRFVGMKSRGFYETPGGTILWQAHRAIESICLDRGAMHLKDELMPKYATLIYNGMWFTPERKMLQAAIDASQDDVTGEVTLKLYKGGVYVQGRSSPYSLYNKDLVGFDAAGGYNQKDAEGFIKLNALRLRIAAWRDKRVGKNNQE
jgi:argininosuccinate synthase